jgi:hypothetical protein
MRDHHRRQIAFLRSVGASDVKILHNGGRHPRLRFAWRGIEHSIPVALSPSDYRATRQAIAALRRLLRQREA